MKGDRYYGCDPAGRDGYEALVELTSNGDGTYTITGCVMVDPDPPPDQVTSPDPNG